MQTSNACLRAGDDVAGRDELVADVAVVVGGGDRPADAAVVQFLGVVQILAAGVAGGVEVADVGEGAPEGADHVALHDLHVVDVEQQLDAGTADHLAQRDAPVGVVAQVAGMIDP